MTQYSHIMMIGLELIPTDIKLNKTGQSLHYALYKWMCTLQCVGDKGDGVGGGGLTFIPRRELNLLKLRSRTSRLGCERRIAISIKFNRVVIADN